MTADCAGMGLWMGPDWMGVFMWANLLLGLGLLVVGIVGVVAGVRWLAGAGRASSQQVQ